MDEWEKQQAAGRAIGPKPVIPPAYPVYQVRSRKYNQANFDAWNSKLEQWATQDFPRRSSFFDPGPPPAKPIQATFWTKRPKSIIPKGYKPNDSQPALTFGLVFWGIIKLITLLSALAIVLFGLFMFIAMLSSLQEALIWTGAALIGIIIAAVIIFRLP